MTPLRIRAVMREPVVYYGDGMHLDGIVAYGVYCGLSRAQQDALPPIRGEWAVDMPLPLARWQCAPPPGCDPRLLDEDGQLWGWRASAVHGDWPLHDRHNVRKMPQTDAMATWAGDGSVNIAGGPHKASDIPYPARWARVLTWYAVGDLAGVYEALGRVRSVGKLANHGMGRVDSWQVEAVDNDGSIEVDGELARTMPSTYRPEVLPRLLGIRPPYHHPSRQIEAVAPVFDRLTVREAV